MTDLLQDLFTAIAIYSAWVLFRALVNHARASSNRIFEAADERAIELSQSLPEMHYDEARHDWNWPKDRSGRRGLAGSAQR